jgi:RimJ/RimL family protein N-acetyltransferase
LALQQSIDHPGAVGSATITLLPLSDGDFMVEFCQFDTDRLTLQEWHRAEINKDDLASSIVAILTETVTQSLPVPWQGKFSIARARSWIDERDSEGTTLLAREKTTGTVIGLMILAEATAAHENKGIEVRLGYVIAETAWGRGFASEMVGGFVTWCSSRSGIYSVAGGVAADNPASARVLKKNGFEMVTEAGVSDGEAIYRRMLR